MTDPRSPICDLAPAGRAHAARVPDPVRHRRPSGMSEPGRHIRRRNGARERHRPVPRGDATRRTSHPSAATGSPRHPSVRPDEDEPSLDCDLSSRVDLFVVLVSDRP